jgi:hypothetical protein
MYNINVLNIYSLRSEGDDSGSKKCKQIYDGAYVAVWRSLVLGCRFSVAFGRSLASVVMKIFSYLIYFENKFSK